jgi:hypothetical protein
MTSIHAIFLFCKDRSQPELKMDDLKTKVDICTPCSTANLYACATIWNANIYNTCSLQFQSAAGYGLND